MATGASGTGRSRRIKTHSSLDSGVPPRTAHRFASIARVGVAMALAPLGLAIMVGSLGLDREGTVGRLNLWTSGGGDQNGFLAFATFLAGLGALVDLILAAVAIVRRHEESLLVYLPLAIGVLAVAFVAVEIVVGHD